MGLRHTCPFCGWSRAAAHPTVLDPACERCGGVLEPAEPAGERPQRGRRLAALSRSRRLDAAVTALVVLPLVLAAAKLGAAHGGPAAGVGAALIAALAASVALAPGGPRRQ